jgi:hypothetical protein
MSISIGGKIVTDGLVIHLDALNPRSYPGSGTDWIDLTLYNNTGSFLNITPTVANGYASFTGENDTSRVFIDNINEITSTTYYVTVDMWARINNPPSFPGDTSATMLCGFGDQSSYSVQIRAANDFLGFTTGTTDIYGIDTVTELGLLDNWKHYCFVMIDTEHTALTEDDQKIYINGQSQVLSQQVNTFGSSYFSLNQPNSSFGFPGRAYTNGGIVLTNMDIALVKVYNRELTQAEVTQNFNAHKGRFNIY